MFRQRSSHIFCEDDVRGEMFSKPGKKKKMPRPGISLIICCHTVLFSSPFDHARNRRNQILSRFCVKGTGNIILYPSSSHFRARGLIPWEEKWWWITYHLCTHILGWFFSFPELAHNNPFHWTTLLLTVPNTFLDSAHNSNFYFSGVFFFPQVLGANIS